MVKLLAYYMASVLILLFYGAEVCQFIHTLTAVKWLGTLFAYYAAAFVIRMSFNRYIINKADPADRPFRQFLYDFTLFILIGFSIAVNNLIFFHFPLGSGMKAFIGVIGLGFFFALDMALKTERQMLTGPEPFTVANLKNRKLFSVSKKIGLILSAGLLLIMAILSLLIVKDFQSLSADSMSADHVIKQLLPAVLKDIFFALMILIVLFLNLIFSYARNIRLYFGKFLTVLRSIEQGQYEQHVSIPSRDEFALLAGHTNRMIDGLKEKERIQNIFGKLVNTRVADMILRKTDDRLLSGSKMNLVILFSDIRGFTAMTEKSDPEIIIADLNVYLTHMVGIIHAHNGIIDKFIGDGIFAVFGFDDACRAANDAVRAALRMTDEIQSINLKLHAPFRIGIGIHCGEVIAGKIGSSERMEYSFIGDSVNTASRLEGLNKDLGTTLIVSESAHQRLDDSVKQMDWKCFRDVSLKGKEKTMTVYGL